MFTFLDDTVTVNVKVMTLTGIYIYRQDRNSSEKSFIPWSEENMSPPGFLKRVRENQAEYQKNFWSPFWTKIWNLIIGLNNPVNVPN